MRALFLLFIPMMALASPQNPTREELLATVKHIQSLAIETQQELDAEKQAHGQTQAALVAAQQANNDTQTQFGAYQKAAETEIQKGNAAISQLNSVLKKLHLAKMIATGLVIAIAGLIALKIPPPIGLYAAGAFAVAGSAAVWIWL